MDPTRALAVVALLAPALAAAREPVVGGPCDGCENVFVGRPADVGPVARIAPPAEPGEPLTIEGSVRWADGAPAAGIIIYAYHTDASGVYPRAATRHGRLRGWARSGDDGRYRFDTIRPGAYPSSREPAHVHMHVIEPGRATYYIDEIVFTDDPRLTDARRRRHPGRGGSGVCTPERVGEGWRVTRDVRLGEKIPGYPPR